jgi:hypothetical protein
VGLLNDKSTLFTASRGSLVSFEKHIFGSFFFTKLRLPLEKISINKYEAATFNTKRVASLVQDTA